jgi:hypothetical protein
MSPRPHALVLAAALFASAPTTLAQPADCLGWSAIGEPFPRTQASLTFDSLRNVTIMTGGRLVALGLPPGNRPLRETWVFDGERWTGLASEGPSAAFGAMCFDTVRGVALHFGGLARLDDLASQDEVARTNALWSWDGTRWTRIPATGAWPQARSEHAFAFDPQRGKAVLFGGLSANNTRLTDLWEFDGTTWTEITPQGAWPTGLTSAVSMAFDPSARWMVVAGSVSGPTAGTWTWDGTGWNQVTVDAPIIGFGNISLAYSTARSRMIAVARGNTLVTRDFNGLTWSPTPVASPRITGISLGQDPRSGEPLIVGLPTITGANSQNVFILQTMQTGNRWMPTELQPSPGDRENGALAHVPPLQGVVLAGGGLTGNTPASSSWTLRGETWRSHVANSPQSNSSTRAGLAWDPMREQLVGSFGAATQVWTPQSQTWTTVTTSPQSNGASRPLVFDAALGAIRGFTSTIAPLRWTGSAWTQVGDEPNPIPFGLQIVSGAIDASGRVVVGGGQAGGSFALNAGSWAPIPGTLQPGTWGGPLAFSPALGGIVTFSGFTDVVPPLTNLSMAEITKVLPTASNAWELVPIAGPGGRKRGAMTWDATAQRIVLHGGVTFGTGDNAISETWMLSQGPAAIAVQPVSREARQGTPTSLSIVASGGGMKQYTWRRNGAVLAWRPDLSGARSDTLRFTSVQPSDAGTYDVTVTNACGSATSVAVTLSVLPNCNSIDFNRDGLFPDDLDLIDFLSVLEGGPCSTGDLCGGIDFNNDDIFPSDEDLVAYLRVLAGGPC